MRPEKKFNDPLLQRLYDTLEWLYEWHGVTLGINAIGGAIDASPEDVILHLKARIFVSECYQMERACLRDQLSGNKRVDEDPEECDTCFHRMFKRGKGWLCKRSGDAAIYSCGSYVIMILIGCFSMFLF
jgi:hypothetical protein